MASKPTGVSIGALVEKDGKVLCVRQVEERGGKWSIPAGHLKPGEMVINGLKREIEEETGYKITPFGLLGVYNRPKEGGVRIAFVFATRIVSGEEKLRAGEIVEIRWFSRDEVRVLLVSDQLYRPEYSVRVLMDWMTGTLYSLDVFKEVQ